MTRMLPARPTGYARLVSIGGDVFSGTPEDLRRRDQAETHIARLHAAGFEQLNWDALELVDGLLVNEQGRAWRRALGERRDGRDAALDAYVIGDDGFPVWLERPESGPTTREELELAQQEREAALAARAEEAEAERQRRRALPQVAITLNDVEREFADMTLASAAAAIDDAGGKLSVHDRALVVKVPLVDPHMLRCAAYLHRGEAAVLAALKSRKPLPDARISPSGKPLP
jgi:hypothetical protein